MRKLLLITILCWIPALTVQAQTIISLPDVKSLCDVQELMDQAVFSDDASDSHMIWAPPGYKKERHGAHVREQLFVLEGKLRLTLDEEIQGAHSWTLGYPAYRYSAYLGNFERLASQDAGHSG